MGSTKANADTDSQDSSLIHRAIRPRAGWGLSPALLDNTKREHADKPLRIALWVSRRQTNLIFCHSGSSTKDWIYINSISVMVLGHAGHVSLLRAKVVANWTCRSFRRTFTSPVPTTGARRRMRITGGFGSSHQPEDILRLRMPCSWCELNSLLDIRQTATRDTSLGK